MGRMVTRGQDSSPAVTEFNRYNRRQLVIGDETIANLPTGGVFYITEIDTFTRSLNQLFGVRAVLSRPTAAQADVVLLVGADYSGI
jgi:transmembrane sensor